MAETSSRPNSTVYVGGLDTALVTAATLSEAFIPFGEISNITLPKPEAPSSKDLHRGFGYVEFEEAADAKEAIDNMNQSELYGRVIKVALAKPDRKETGEAGLGSTTAIWESVCLSQRLGFIMASSNGQALILCRKGILRNMPVLPMKTGKRLSSPEMNGPKIPCRVSKASMSQAQSLSERCIMIV
jgi:RNA recognition motif-containing protein